jgi:two-component system OmpR family sensor kinase
MAMVSMYKLPFHRRLLLYLLVFAFFYLLCFLAFQYNKEKDYKIEELNDRLQIINVQAFYTYKEKGDLTTFIRTHNTGEFEGLRITAIDLKGKVLYDSTRPASEMPNHANRPEVRQAILTGEGYILRRHSSTTNLNYFYNATRYEGIVIRSALPYTLTLIDVLRVDRNFIWFMIVCALVVSLLSYFMTHRLGHNIRHLREFAVKAEKGERIDNIEPFMKDELGDVSNAIVRLYIQLRQAKDALVNEHNLVLHQEQEQIRIKRQLTQNINHELKTPVSSIEGYLETIINNPQLDETKKNEFIEKCYAQVIRMSNLLGDVSTITRMDEGGNVISKERICLSNLIREVFDDMAIKLEEKNITPVFDILDNMYILGNQSLLQSIFRNLLDNAIAYSGCNTVFMSLVEESPERYVFSFADNGVGIDEVHLSRIFERFYRIDKGRSRKLGGTGLGLSIVKNAVIFHGGAIVARTREGGGLEFVFALKKE